MVLYFICPQSQIQDRQAASQIALLHSFSSFHELRVMNHHSLSLLESTLMEPLVSVANKELTGSPNPLESTLTKNRGGGGGVLWLTKNPIGVSVLFTLSLDGSG